jgi:D-cysteine desulfhydrase
MPAPDRPILHLATPTPVHRLDGLANALGVRAPLWVKRDDLSAPAYGGNTPRKLARILPDAAARGRRTVVTFGGLGSNHALATTVHGAALGLRTVLVLVPQPVTARVVHTLRLDSALGAEIHCAAGLAAAARRAFAILARSWRSGDRALLVPPGGSSPLGAAGQIDAGLELAAQVRAGELPEPAAVYVAVGSGGTAAGLAVGLRAGGLRTQVVGVVVTDVLPPSMKRLRRLAHAAARRHETASGTRLPPDAIRLVHSAVGPGYGHATPEASRAVAFAAERAALPLETTYTGKCLAALARDVPGDGRPVLFWNTVSSIEPLPPDGHLPPVSALPVAVRRLVGA